MPPPSFPKQASGKRNSQTTCMAHAWRDHPPLRRATVRNMCLATLFGSLRMSPSQTRNVSHPNFVSV